ncbi:IclR family transcriptional regulator [Fredinandcohnia humi]
MDTYEVATLKKGLQIIDLLRKNHAMTQSEIMKELALNKTSVFRMLYTLEKMKYVMKYKKYYQLNLHIFRDEHFAWHKGIQWTSLVAPYHLARQEQITSYVGILQDCEMVTKNVVEAPYVEPQLSKIELRTPLHTSALGKAVLAGLPIAKQREILNWIVLETFTRNTFQDYDLLLHHLQVIKSQGYAVDDEETNIGFRCIAAPIFINDEVIGAIALHGTTEQIKKNSIKSLAKKTVQASQHLSLEIQHFDSLKVNELTGRT